MSHFILAELNGPLFVFLGLVAWALAYVYLTRVITPDAIGDLMTLIVAVLPVLCLIVAGAVAFVSLHAKRQHIAVGIIFVIIALLAATVAIVQYVGSGERRPEFRKALTKSAKRPHPVRSTIATILWGLIGAMLVFGSEFGLIFGGWQFLQGSRLLGVASAGPGLVIFGLSLRGDATTKNPVRRAVLALKDDDRSTPLVDRLLKRS